MKIRLTGTLVIVLCAFVILSCDGFFDANVFSVFDGPPKIDIEQLDEGDLDDLAIALQSDEFYEDLTDDEKDVVEDFLLDQATKATASSQTRATASEALSEYYKNTTPVGDALDNVANVLDTVLAGDGSDESALEDVVGAIVPAESLESEESFKELVEGFQKLTETYGAMNDALSDADATLENSGTAFQAAAVAYLLDSTLEAMVAPDEDPTVSDEDEKIALLYDAVTADDPTTVPEITFEPSYDPGRIVTDMAEPGSGIEHIVAEAGFATLLGQIASMFDM